MSKCDPAANVNLEEPIVAPSRGGKASEIQQMKRANKYHMQGRLESREKKKSNSNGSGIQGMYQVQQC